MKGAIQVKVHAKKNCGLGFLVHGGYEKLSCRDWKLEESTGPVLLLGFLLGRVE